MNLISIYGERFKGTIVAEHVNVVIAEDELGRRYTVHKSTLGEHAPKQQSRVRYKTFNLKETMEMESPPKRVFEGSLQHGIT